MQKIWKYIFRNKLRIKPEEYNVMLTESFMNTKYNKEKITQIMFEKYNVKGLYVQNPNVLSIYSVGKYNNIECNFGDILTQIVPIYDGYSLIYSINQLDITGILFYLKNL